MSVSVQLEDDNMTANTDRNYRNYSYSSKL